MRALSSLVLVVQLGSYSIIKVDDGAEWQRDWVMTGLGIKAFHLLAFGLVNSTHL